MSKTLVMMLVPDTYALRELWAAAPAGVRYVELQIREDELLLPMPQLLTRIVQPMVAQLRQIEG